MRVYLSGPITDNKNYHLDFLKAENRVTSIFKGADVINPMWLKNMLPNGKHEEYMEICLQLVGMVDMMVMLPGWEKSKGSTIERSLAKEIGISIIELSELEQNTPTEAK